MNRLDDILHFKRKEVDARKQELSLDMLKGRIPSRSDERSFAKSIRREGKMSLIAEIKKASPSAGVIRPDFQPTSIARAYEAGGAQALSVLTDQRFFQGELKYLLQARAATHLPCLRKDFIIDEYQIWEARLADADAILLIVAALERMQLLEFYMQARDLGMDALVEVHDAAELETAIGIGANLIGINNRNLQTFKTDLNTTESLAQGLSSEITLVAESGIFTPDDVRRMRDAGAHAVLVGESLMRQPNVDEAVRKLMN